MSRLTHDELRRFTGDLERYRHGFVQNLIYTPGIRYLATSGGAYWLIDAIALRMTGRSMKAAMRADPRLSEMQFWSLTVEPGGPATLRCVADAGAPAVVTEVIPWTDFPLDHIDLWAAFDGRYWTLYLPSEH
jgi:hypothetical protein